MEIKDYLIVYGWNVQRNLSCYKESIINCNDLVEYSEIIKAILDNRGNLNWAWGIDLIPNKNPEVPYAYTEIDKLLEMYPNLSKSKLKDFCNYLPSGITRIESIKIFSGQKIKII